MIEALLVFGLVGLLAALGLLAPLVPAEWLVFGGAGVAALGLALGVPTGFWYHVKLARFLRARGPLPARWWIRPVSLHGDLLDHERPVVMRWFVIGGAGFGLTMLGCVLSVLGVALQALRTFA